MLSTLAQRLHILRKGRQLTLNQLATALNQRSTTNHKLNTEAQIGRWERGNRSPAYPEIIKLAQYFDVSIDYLVGRSDTNDEDIATSIMADKRLLFEDQLLSSSDRSEIYQLIRGYLHAKKLRSDDIKATQQDEIRLPLNKQQVNHPHHKTSEEIELPLEEDHHEQK